VNDNKHGVGKITFVNGEVFEGQWEYDKIVGEGRMTLPDGRTSMRRFDGDDSGGNDTDSSGLVVPDSEVYSPFHQKAGKKSRAKKRKSRKSSKKRKSRKSKR
jgi:hypothetical protein